jgi:hypothetical protein
VGLDCTDDVEGDSNGFGGVCKGARGGVNRCKAGVGDGGTVCGGMTKGSGMS